MTEDMIVYRCSSCQWLFAYDQPVCHDFEEYCQYPRYKDPQYNVTFSQEEYLCSWEQN
jgi:hypothetical protein